MSTVRIIKSGITAANGVARDLRRGLARQRGERGRPMRPVEAARELWATLADVWRCADVFAHLCCWWGVVSGVVDVDAHGPCICSELGSPAALVGDHAAWCPAVTKQN